jgi:hypothetical protein
VLFGAQLLLSGGTMEDLPDRRLRLKRVDSCGQLSLFEGWGNFQIQIGPVILYFDYLEEAKNVFNSIIKFEVKGG